MHAYTSPTVPRGSFTQIPFWKLRARFRECGMFDEEVAQAAGITLPTFGRRMRGTAPWLTSEVKAVCEVVGIPRDEIGIYFFPDFPSNEKDAPAD